MTLNLTAEHKMLLALATKAQKNAHAPYSNFHVGAAILDENAQLHASCNVENAAYPLGQCAEAGAISAMVASGSKQIKQILIASPIRGGVSPTYVRSLMNVLFSKMNKIGGGPNAPYKMQWASISGTTDDFCPPCGGCRQKIAEFANGQTEVHLATNKGEIKTVMFTELLPLAFGFDKEQAQS